jgi:hypothetical protein
LPWATCFRPLRGFVELVLEIKKSAYAHYKADEDEPSKTDKEECSRQPSEEEASNREDARQPNCNNTQDQQHFAAFTRASGQSRARIAQATL